MRTIILASSSPRRKQLLESVGVPFKVIPSNIKEKMNPRLGAAAQAKRLSLQKAVAVADGFMGQNVVIIAADSIVVIESEQLGKPENTEDAERMLRKLSGKKHITVTGFTLLDCLSGKKSTKSVETSLWMRKLTDSEIKSYIKKVDVFDKAGSYAVQDLGAILFEKIEGDYLNVLGLPMVSLYKELRKFGVNLL